MKLDAPTLKRFVPQEGTPLQLSAFRQPRFVAHSIDDLKSFFEKFHEREQKRLRRHPLLALYHHLEKKEVPLGWVIQHAPTPEAFQQLWGRSRLQHKLSLLRLVQPRVYDNVCKWAERLRDERRMSDQAALSYIVKRIQPPTVEEVLSAKMRTL